MSLLKFLTKSDIEKEGKKPVEFEEPKSVYGRIKNEKYRERIYRLPVNGEWNPLLKYPRNKGCFCGSGLKSKKCCLPYVSRVIATKFAVELKEKWLEILTGQQTFPRAPR